MPITTKDLARMCGVSRATVTRALHDTGRISGETKRKILKMAAEMGYQPDLVARSLVKGTSMTIGVVVVDLKNQYFPEMISAMEIRAAQSDYLLNITMNSNSKETEMRLIKLLVGHRVDGLIIISINKGKEFEHYLEELNVPVVLIGNNMNSRLSYVGIDEFGAARDATEYILSKGYKDIVFVVPPLKDKDGVYNVGHKQRLEGYSAAITRAKGIVNVIEGDGYVQKAADYLKQTGKRTAFLCSGDIYAVYLMQKLQKEGYQVKKDYGVMGFDCIDVFQNMNPQLTTVDNHVSRIGYEAADLLIRLIEGYKSEGEIVISYDIVHGDSI